MTPLDLVALLPLIVLAAGSVAEILIVAFRRSHAVAAASAAISLLLALATLPVVASGDVPHRVTSLLILDHYALFYMGLVFAAGLVVVAISYGYFEKHDAEREEFYPLLLLATIGSAVLVAAGHFAAFFLGLEILTVSLYALIAYLRDLERCVEAGVKYLILAAASSAFLLFGMALIYAETGTMEFARVAEAAHANPRNILMSAGLAMIVVGVGFKLALAPFHMWIPDVYEGAPAPVTAFIATVSKSAVFAVVLRYFSLFDARAHSAGAYLPVFLLFAVTATASMFVGNLLALMQRNVKRLLAYSSIAHFGYVTVAFLAGGRAAAVAVTFYLVAYTLTTLAAFGVVSVLSTRDRDADDIDDYRGLAWRRPWTAGVLTAALLSLAGIPLTAGFIGKFVVLAAGIGSALWFLAIVLVVNSAIGLFYYLRVIVAVYALPAKREVVGAEAQGLPPVRSAAEQTTDRPVPLCVLADVGPRAPTPAAPGSPPSLSLVGSAALAILTLLVLWIGVYPGPLLDLIRRMVGGIS